MAVTSAEKRRRRALMGAIARTREPVVVRLRHGLEPVNGEPLDPCALLPQMRRYDIRPRHPSAFRRLWDIAIATRLELP